MHPALSEYPILLLDLNSTFMFGEDRFGSGYDYYATYRSLGGGRLSEADLRSSVDACCAELDRIYRDDSCFDNFPTVALVLTGLPRPRSFPQEELELIERVIAAHEVGHVPPEYAAAIRKLARTHRLGLVSNVWSKKDLHVAELQRSGILDRFSTLVFSSDGRTIKPSRAMFEQALNALDASPSEVVVVGDSLRCDVGGAAAAGLASVWINRQGERAPNSRVTPDWIVHDLRDLLDPMFAASNTLGKADVRQK